MSSNANKLRPGCGSPPSEKSMWVSGNPCLTRTCDLKDCCFDAKPGVTEVKECSLVTIDDDCVIVQLTPDNIATADPAEVYFSMKSIYPLDYCKQRTVHWDFDIECECVNWCEDADEEFKAAAWKLAGRRNQIRCTNLNC